MPPCERPAAGQKQGTADLTACLTLVAPTGMTADERNQWLQVARQTLSGIPVDLLTRGCAAARLKCRFVSEIVPAIMSEIGEEWDRRKRIQREAGQAAQPRLGQKAEGYVSPEEAAAILAQVGLRSLGGFEA